MPRNSCAPLEMESAKVLVVDLTRGKGRVVHMENREEFIGGSGLAAALFQKFGHPEKPWDDPDQPVIFAVGPLTGFYPLMSKVVCGFKSPYHNQYAESHAGGRTALCMRLAGYEAIVFIGRSKQLMAVNVGSKSLDFTSVDFLKDSGAYKTGKVLRQIHGTKATGARSICRIGPAGENLVSYACINADSYRHYGRLGGGAAMGAKRLKGFIITGDGTLLLPEGKAYKSLFHEIYQQVTATKMMSKYHNLGTAANISDLNELKALPWRNLQATADPGAAGISGENFAKETLLRNGACSACPVGCIHVGMVREMFDVENRYLYRQVPYDYEPIFSLGSMLGITDQVELLGLLDKVEKVGVDAMSAGVALAWATEALEKGIISRKETLTDLKFGDSYGYRQAIILLSQGANEFYNALGKGTLVAAKQYGGEEFACVLGQEMGGYATGEVSYVAQALGFRHSHLDTGGYSYDQKGEDWTVDQALDFMKGDEEGRVMLTCMVSCLFARGVYKQEILQEALSVLGAQSLAGNLGEAVKRVTRLRWQTRLSTGYKPHDIKIPKRYYEVENWKGKADPDKLGQLKQSYADYIMGMA
jgi:aldehyde:ferredoxin oxidoreductase